MAPDLAASLMVLAMHLRKAGGLAFTPLGLSWREAVMLLAIERGVIRPMDLAKEFGMVMPTVSGLGAKFVASGLIERNVRKQDAREVTYDLTTKGRALCAQLRRAWEENLPPELVGLSAQEVKLWVRVLDRLRTGAES